MFNGKTILAVCLSISVLALCAQGQTATSAPAQGNAPQAGMPTVCKLKMTTDAVPDFNSVEDLFKQIIKPGMSDEEKCTAAWKVIYQNRFWNPPARGELDWMGGVDPILYMNCFTRSICQQDAEMLLGLWAQLGYSTRMWQLGWHTTSEVFWDGKWRHLDSTNGSITRDAKGQITSVTERKDLRNGQTWVRPDSYVSHSDGYMIGHRMELALRPGESFTRYWTPLGMTEDYWHPTAGGERPYDQARGEKTRMQGVMDMKPRQFDLLPMDASYANGQWVFQPDFGSADGRNLMEECVNVTVGAKDGKTFLRPEAAGKEGWATFRVRSPYLMSGGWVTGVVNCPGGAKVEVLVSDCNGAMWQPMWTCQGKSGEQARVALREGICGALDYLVRIKFAATDNPQDVQIENLKFETIVENNPFVLPSLKLGQTEVSVAAGPQVETMIIEPYLDRPTYRNLIVEEKNVVTAREQKQEGWVQGWCAKEPDQESYVVMKVTTPGEMRRLRWGGIYENDNSTTKLWYSFDGKDWQEKPWSYQQSVKKSENEKRSQIFDSETLDNLPAGTNTVWLKFWFMRKGPVTDPCQLLLCRGLRIDADYAGKAAPQPAPVKITYCWLENQGDTQAEKTHVQVVKSYPFRYSVTVDGDSQPTMKWVKLELDQAGPSPAAVAGK